MLASVSHHNKYYQLQTILLQIQITMKSAMNTSAELASLHFNQRSFQSTSQIRLCNPYLPSENKTRSKHCRIKTDEFNPYKAQSTISTCVDVKAKVTTCKNPKPAKKLSASFSNLKKNGSQKNLSSTIQVKTCSLTKPPVTNHKITLHRRLCTLESLQKLRSELPTMNPQQAAKEHKNISQKLKNKNQIPNSATNQAKIISEYQLLTQQLFDVIGNLKKKHEKELKQKKADSLNKQQRIIKKYGELAAKNVNYCLLVNELRREVNTESLGCRKILHMPHNKD